jgi:hypothetical protein
MADDDERPCCRICFDCSETRHNPLFRPCHCRGTSAFVHVECLDTWRKTSVNPKSFFECDSCKFKYKFGTGVLGDRLLVARLISTAGAIHALALTALATLVFLGGFVGKMADPSLDWWDVLRCFNVHHLLTGATTTGIGSLLGWAASSVGGAFFHFNYFGDAFNTRGNDRDGLVGGLLLAAATIAGLCVAFSWIYSRLEKWARTVSRHAQHVVLDVQGGAAPRARPPATQNSPYVAVD